MIQQEDDFDYILSNKNEKDNLRSSKSDINDMKLPSSSSLQSSSSLHINHNSNLKNFASPTLSSTRNTINNKIIFNDNNNNSNEDKDFNDNDISVIVNSNNNFDDIQDIDNINYNPKLTIRDYIEFMLIFGDDNSQVGCIQKIFSKKIGKIDTQINNPTPFGFRSSCYLFITSLLYMKLPKAVTVFIAYNLFGFLIMLFLGYFSYFLQDTNIPHWIKGIESGFSSAGVGFLVLNLLSLLKTNNGIKLIFKSYYTKLIFLLVCSISLFYHNWISLLGIVFIISLIVISIHMIVITVSQRMKYLVVNQTMNDLNNNNNSNNIGINSDIDSISNNIEINNMISLQNGCGVTKVQSLASFSIYLVTLAVIQICSVSLPQSLEAQLAKTYFTIGSLMIGGGGYFTLPVMMFYIKDFIRMEEFFKGFTIVQVLPGSIANFSAFLGASSLNIGLGVLLWFCLVIPGILLNLTFINYWEKIHSSLFITGILDCIKTATISLSLVSVVSLWTAGIYTYEFSVISIIVIGLVSLFDLKAPVVITIAGITGFLVQKLFYTV